MPARANLLRDSGDAAAELRQCLDRQRRAFLADPYPSAALRRDRLSRAIAMLTANKPRLLQALEADFGARAEAISLIADILAPSLALKNARRNVARWMRPERRSPEFPMALLGVKAWIEFQPLGVVGIVAPWNAPVALSLTPLAGVLAAGNRAMIKPSETSPAVSALLAEMVAATFDPDEVAVVQGGIDVSRSFVALPFDHVLFTGGGVVARDVLRAASANLTPVTLELGGKSPAIVADDADIAAAAAKIIGGKLSNAGQICMCPDHAWVPADRMEAFVTAASAAARRMFPTIAGNPDCTAVVGERSRARLMAAIEEAERGGARVIRLGAPDPARPGVMPLCIVVDPPAGSVLAAEEVFGPVLPVRSYRDLPALVGMLNAGPTPLALYFFGRRPADIALIRTASRAGGMTLGDVMLHPFMQDLPFGGLGESGMGRYIGRDGFKTFSHQKSTVQRGWVDIGKYLQPPYSPRMLKLLHFATRS
jgi:coniferyl-aldehyde dehydrogenase